MLGRPSPAKRLNLVNRQAHEVLADYVRAVTVLQPHPLPKPTCRDPDDDEVLALALLAQADLIVSGDNDLLAMRGFEGIEILTAPEALLRIKTP